MTYDDWKTSPPEYPPNKCTCEYDEEGECDDPCEFCQMQKEWERREAARDAYWDQKIDEALGK